jgi:hypothetical protein
MRKAIDHYEAALKEAFPSGATDDVFHHWNEARKLLEEAEKQEPVAWVDVKDSYEGPYEFHGIERMGVGKHLLYTAPVHARPVVHAVRCTYPQCQATNGCVGACAKGQAEKQEPVAQAWDEGYRTGINDERMSEANIGIAGFGAKVEPARNNPYRTTPPAQAPVHASDISQEPVDETAKDRHISYVCPNCHWSLDKQVRTHTPEDIKKIESKWVGLDDDIPGLGLVTEEFYNGMLCAEDILKEKNT